MNDLFDNPELAGRLAAEVCAETAESRGWDREAARAFILDYLRRHGPTSGEVLVSEASKLYPPHKDKAYGGIFSHLSRQGVIVKCGMVPRSKGHNSGAAWIWKLSEARGEQ